VRSVDLIVEIQLRFQVPSAQHGWGLRVKSFLTRDFPGFRNYQEINKLKINLDVATVLGKSLLLTHINCTTSVCDLDYL